MSCVDCKKNCKMTKMLRESKYCTGVAELTDEGLIFGCQKLIVEAELEEKNLLTCIFWDMQLKERCFKCPLRCENNKNKDLEHREREIRELDKVLSSMNNFGITAEKSYKIVDNFKKNGGIDADTLSAIGLSNSLLNKSMSGSSYDISHFQYIVKDIIRKVNIKNKN